MSTEKKETEEIVLVIKEKVKIKPKIHKRVEGSYEREISYDGY